MELHEGVTEAFRKARRPPGANMPKVLNFADPSNGRPGLGATIQLDNGEPCLISIAQTGMLVKKSRFGFMGPVLYNEKNIYQAAATAKALSERFPDSLLPPGFTDPVLSAFANAVLHCASCAEVAVTLNEVLKTERPEQAMATKANAQPTQGGSTLESAIPIHAANSLEGIPKEYAILRAMFGTEQRDWKLIDRFLTHTDDGRKIEKLIVNASGKRKEVYFDVTSFVSGNDAHARAALDNLMATQDKKLSVVLPREEFMTLQVGLLHLTEAQLKQIGLSLADRKSMLDPFLDEMKQWHGKEYGSIPEHVTVTTLISVWMKIFGLLKAWEPANILQEEELENLKAIIGGTIKAARSAPC